ncbi:MAG TPA: PilX N-terminal domain-containing pilus assembly protein [Blastocatellia bacterium]|nr:PilX N-terminal domain-containing pilus assembly protein [Blastocatellia bacterium]
MRNTKKTYNGKGERGAALIIALLTLALLLALVMGISLTAVSELGVSGTYGSQTQALQAAEAGINHATSLVANYTGADFTGLLGLRPSPLSQDYLTGNNPFTAANAAQFAPNCQMIINEDPDPNRNRGYRVRDGITGAPVTPEAYYRVSLLDDEPSNSTALPRVPNFIPGVAYREMVAPNANNPGIDKNNRIVVYSTGTYSNASVTLEGWIAFLPFPALSANRDIQITGSADISGAYGGIHSNEDVLESGNGWSVEQTITAVGNLVGDFTGQVGGFYGGGQARLDLPEFVTRAPLVAGGPQTAPRIQDYLIRRADILLIDPNFGDGAHKQFPSTNNAAARDLAMLAERLNIDYTALANAVDTPTNNGNNIQQTAAVAISINRANPNAQGTPVKIANVSNTGWSYGGGKWGILTNNNTANGHTYYVIGRNNYPAAPNGGSVELNGNIGGNGAPMSVSIFSTGSIEVRGNTNITANLRNLQTPLLPPFVQIDALMFAVEDIKVNGDFAASIEFTGISYAGEAVDLSGNGSINGQVVAFNWPNINGSVVQGINGDPNANVVTGSFELTLNDGNSIGRVKLFSWRQIKR